MADKKAQAMERLLTKLSAVRKTLRGEERMLLDAMVLSAQSEVELHQLHDRAQPALESIKQPKPQARKQPAADASKMPEVELHSLTSRNLPKPAAKAQPQAEARFWPKIQLTDGNYRVTIL